MSDPRSSPSAPVDRRARPLRDLRVSVTERCNFRCVYCMPREIFGREYQFLDRTDLLTFEEIARLVVGSAQAAYGPSAMIYSLRRAFSFR